MNNTEEMVKRTEEREMAEKALVRDVYEASLKVLEALDRRKHIFGNTHHVAQNISEFAKQELLKHWRS